MELLHERYEVMKKLGKGGIGSVFQVMDQRLHMEFASKRILLEDELAMKSFQREIWILSKLHHPNIPRIIDQFEEAGYAYVIMDQIEGAPLMEYLLHQTNLQEEKVLQWMLQICDIFCYLHSLKPYPLLYLDLKPQNIMISKDGTLFLIDFGSSCMDAQCHVQFATAGYASKEVLHQHVACIQSDIYSFGITFYVLLHGHFPSDRKKQYSLDKILFKCSMPKIEDRYPSFEKVRKVLLHKALRKKRNLFQPIVSFSFSVLFFVLGCMQYHTLVNQRTQNYLKAMRKQAYETAITLEPQKIEAYQKYYDQQCNDQSSCERTFVRVEELINENKQTNNTQLCVWYGMKAMQQQDIAGYKKAIAYLSRVDSQDSKETSILKDIIALAQLLSKERISKAQLKKVETTLYRIEEYGESLQEVPLKYSFHKVVLTVYDACRTMLKDSEEAILRICGHMEKLLQSSPDELPLSDLVYLNERKAYCTYYQGNKAYEQKDYEKMSKYYMQSIKYFAKSLKKERYTLMSTIEITMFEYGIKDLEKKEHLEHLYSAKQYCEQIENQETKTYLMNLINVYLENYGT